jgi:hypothetical protein
MATLSLHLVQTSFSWEKWPKGKSIKLINSILNIMLIQLKQFINQNREDLSFIRIYKALYRRLTSMKHLVVWTIPFGFSKKNKIQLKKFKNIHKGKKCFIIANGPSLKKVDFSLLKDEITIGMNRIYLLEETTGFMPNYLVCEDGEIQIKQFYRDFNEIAIPSFFNWDYRKYLKKNDNQFFIRQSFNPKFGKEITKTIGNGKSVTYACIQIAYYMGFSEVYLVGKDHSYKTTQHVGARITSDGSETNHFIKGYYEKGQKWLAPDYKGEELAYSIAREIFEKEKIVIKDATINGKLTIFEKVDFNSLFHNKKN